MADATRAYQKCFEDIRITIKTIFNDGNETTKLYGFGFETDTSENIRLYELIEKD